MTENSTITIVRRSKICRASSGAISTLAPVTHIAFGDGGVDAMGDPIIPQETQTALNHEIARYPVSSIEYPVETTARYGATIPKEDLVDKFISEAALVDSDGEVVAIKTMYAKQKDEGTAFTFKFDDEF